MIEAQADIALGEAIRPAAEAHRRISGVGFGSLLAAATLFAVITVAGTFLAAWLHRYLGPLADLLSLVAFVAAAVAAVALYSRLALNGFLKGLKQIGSPDVFPTRFCFDEQRIAIETVRASHSLPWEAVQLVLASRQHWLVQADTTTFAIPKRAFSSSLNEQAFVILAKNRLSKDALADLNLVLISVWQSRPRRLLVGRGNARQGRHFDRA